ncbi:gas vesicle protein GvpK [Streptomyces sp. bgisy159]|uniref:gas vesicle protein GvpK n=1 Tax=Streptomyces sp. bgisy159 TaxID=3413795 RepID=UPI003F49D030
MPEPYGRDGGGEIALVDTLDRLLAGGVVVSGDLTEEQEERIGLTLMLLDDRMTELRERYGLRPEDLNLDLGPLGPLLPRE